MATRVLSIEGNNLSSSIITSRSVDYKDVDLSFKINGKKDVFKKTDAAAVKQAVKNLILTDHGEKPFNYYFGANIRELLFELFYTGISIDIEQRITAAINNFEPRAFVQNISVKESQSQNELIVTLVFRITNIEEPVVLETTLSRLR